jgi:putative two-component system response regulator
MVLSGNLLYHLVRDFDAVLEHSVKQNSNIEKVNNQLLKYAEDFSTTIAELKKVNEELQEAYLDTIHCLVKASEYKDKETGDHIIRIGKSSAYIGHVFGLPSDEVELLQCASPMHDTGKIGIPDHILLKPGRLNDDEFLLMQSHTEIGAMILSHSKAKVLDWAKQIALYHHERWDGTGYPKKLQRDEIPLSARIVCLVDTFDALTADRPYKKAYPADVAINIILAGKNRQFDPILVDLFMDVRTELIEKCFSHIRRTLDPSETLILSERDKDSAKTSEE